MRYFLCALLTVALITIVGAVPAMASDILATGSSSVPGDWSQEWLESGVGTFNTILLISESGDGLATPGLTDVSGG